MIVLGSGGFDTENGIEPDNHFRTVDRKSKPAAISGSQVHQRAVRIDVRLVSQTSSTARESRLERVSVPPSTTEPPRAVEQKAVGLSRRSMVIR